MINPVELFVGLRYLRAKRRTRFVSFITLISLLGIALGVAALIVILSVMNGFEGELRGRLLSMSAHGFVTGTDGRTHDWRQMVDDVKAEQGVAVAAPIVELEGMIQSGRDLQAVLIHGIDPQYEQQFSGDVINLLEGSLSDLRPGSRGIILGRVLAFDLGARIGDGVVLLVPRPVGDGTMEPVLQRFVMQGVFEAGLQDHDSILALVNANDAADIVGLGDAGELGAFPRGGRNGCAGNFAQRLAGAARRRAEQRLDDRERELLPRNQAREDDDVAAACR